MASSKSIKNRIRSTKSIKQITKAMEAVSAVKMRKSEQVALRARPYALAAIEMLRGLSAKLDNDFYSLSPLLSAPADMPTCLVVVTSDKGLAGSFNTNVLRKALAFTKEHAGTEVIAVGKKGRDFLKRRGVKIVESFIGAGDFADLSETAPVADLIKKGFADKRWSAVHLLYTNFLSALKQEVVNRKVLPFDFESLNTIVSGITPTRGKYANMPEVLGKETDSESAYVFEPSPKEVLGELLPALLDIEIYHAVLEGNASEHSSRMIAMRNASDNAGELIDELTLQYNKARQAQITKELSEITAGAAALQD
ncbi:MAG TPA: ATP synthase F1 subunit gamma [Candidatus Paceibacterota bacterium]